MRRVRFGTRAGLILAALAVQAIVLSLGWFATFRVVQRSFGQVIQDRTIEQTRQFAERIASLIPDHAGTPEYGSDEWQRLQDFIRLDAFRELPDGGFACLIESDGRILCHPDIEQDPSIRRFSFEGRRLLAGLEPGAASSPILTTDGMATAAGVMQFAADNFHFVATRPLPGSGLRLVVHQPADALLRVSERNTRWIMGVAALAAMVVLGVTGTGLGMLLRRYEGAHEALNRQLRNNLLIARSIQEKTLPASLPQPPGLEIAGWSRPAEETGGDTFDVVPLHAPPAAACNITNPPSPAQASAPPDRVAFLLADATGHGIGPALAVTQLHATLRITLRVGISPTDAAALINAQLHDSLPMGRFVTALFGVADARTGQVQLLSAGQGPMLWWRAAQGTVEELAADTYPLGILPELGSTEPQHLTLQPGDVLCFVSDGIVEAPGPANDRFRIPRLIALLESCHDKPAEEIARHIAEAVDHFTRHADPDDDRTVLVLKRTNP